MLKSCLPYLGSPDCLDNNNKNNNDDPTKSKELFEEEGGHNHNHNSSFDSTFESTSKQIFVRVVHAGGRVDHYPNAILAGKLLEKLPGKWLARPEVFKHPHESILCPEEYLVPGHKYYVVPVSTIHKLKRKHTKITNKQLVLDTIITTQDHNTSSDVLEATTTTKHHQSTTDHEEWMMDDDDHSFCSARDFYVSKDKWSRSRSRSRSSGSGSGSRRARILLPLPKPKAWSGYTWEPGLTSIQELSP